MTVFPKHNFIRVDECSLAVLGFETACPQNVIFSPNFIFSGGIGIFFFDSIDIKLSTELTFSKNDRI